MVNQYNTDDIYFISLETRLAVMVRAGKLSMINSEINALTQLRSVVITLPEVIPASVSEQALSLRVYLAKSFIGNTAFRRAGELLYLTYTSTWTTSHTSPMLNDFKYFSLLFSRYGSLRPKFDLRSQYLISTQWLEYPERYSIRSFWYKRRFVLFNSIAQPFYLMQLLCIHQATELWFAYKQYPHHAEKWQNISILAASPNAYSGFLYFDEI